MPVNIYYMNINELAWDFALCLKLIRNPLILNNLISYYK